jgi:hypothetical protein
MNPALMRVFATRTYFFVRVTPNGFVAHQDGETLTQIVGHIHKHHLIRKRFDDSVLACDSKDGRRSRTGIICDECLHPMCRPQLRVHLITEFSSRIVYVFDLPITSAQNLLRIAAEIEADRQNLKDVCLRLTVYNQGHWGEVRFERAS